LCGELLLDCLQPQPHLALHHAFAGAIAFQWMAGKVVGGGVADVLDDGGIDVAEIDEAAGE